MLPSVHGLNDNVVTDNAVIDSVRESRQYGPPGFLMCSLIREWILDNAADKLVDSLSELVAET